MAKRFRTYLKAAVDRALEDEHTGEDSGNLQWIHNLARRGAEKNWKALTPKGFLEQYLWCVGGIQKRYKVREAHFPLQVKLFHSCDATAISHHETAIRASWRKDKCDLNSRMFEAVISTAKEVAVDWDGFKDKHLLDPRSESMDDWWGVYDALDRLPMVGDAIAWYLIRNLYGGPFFKPDVHITAIADHYFNSRVDAMSQDVRKLWPQVCSDSRLKSVHLGEVDYILWWYRRITGDPRTPQSGPKA
jgi:hypothetical protein